MIVKKNKNVHTLGYYLKFGLYRMPVYSRFGLDRLCNIKNIKAVSQFAFLSIYLDEISLKVTDEIKWSA